jgi:phosphohistidine phosphatase
VGARRLTLLRHGKAQSIDACAEDFERALTHRGGLEAAEMAKRMVRRGLIPDLLLVSPAERAWSTAEAIAGACELEAKQVQCARELYLATPEAIWGLLARRGAALPHIMVCGHNPALSQIASRFGPKPRPRELPTAGVVTASWRDADWSTLQPEAADTCEADDPENMTDQWT